MLTLNKALDNAKQYSLESSSTWYVLAGIVCNCKGAVADAPNESLEVQYTTSIRPASGVLCGFQNGHRIPVHGLRLSVVVEAPIPVITNLAGIPVPATGGK